MQTKRLYTTVEEKEQLRALAKQYGLEDLAARLRQKAEPQQPIPTGKRDRRRAGQCVPH